jgi:hypothetical protein
MFAKHGNHFYNTNFRSDADVKRGYKLNNIDFQKLVEDCRDFTKHVPFYENLSGSTFTAGGGLQVARVNMIGNEDMVTNGPANVTLIGYWAAFELACEARERAIEKSLYTEFLTAVTQGLASIESYINYRAEIWNITHSEDRLIDSRQDKVSLDSKIDYWIPKMTGGKKLDKSKAYWENFKKLRAIRDDLAIHPKSSGYIIALNVLAEKINLFRSGVAELLIQIHLLFDERIPAIIIRAAYLPEIEVTEVAD